MEFTGILENFSQSAIGYHVHIKIPSDILFILLEKCPDKRVVCTLDKQLQFHCALMPKGSFHYILLNQELVKKNKLTIGQKLLVSLEKDNSRYGVPISEEMEEVLHSDPQGSDLFHLLTPGKQRSLIYMINKFKSSQLKIERSFVILDHLKKRKGFLDFKGLNDDFKAFQETKKM